MARVASPRQESVRRVRVRAAIALSVCLVLIVVFLSPIGTRTEAPVCRWRVRQLARMRESDIERILILTSDRLGCRVDLRPGTDAQDIRRLLKVAQRIRVEDRVALARRDEFISFHTKHGRIQMWGHFDPKRAPVISPNMRSDDLGWIVQGIAKRKGVQARRPEGPAERTRWIDTNRTRILVALLGLLVLYLAFSALRRLRSRLPG